MAMTEQAAEARRAYKREWYAKNKDKQRAYAQRYWAKKARETASERKEAEDIGRGGEQ